MAWRTDSIVAAAGSALLHAAVFIALIMGTGRGPPPKAAQTAISVRLVTEPESDRAAAPAGAVGPSSPEPVAAAAPIPQVELVPPASHAVAPPPKPRAAREKRKRKDQPRRLVAALTAPPAGASVDTQAPAAAVATPPSAEPVAAPSSLGNEETPSSRASKTDTAATTSTLPLSADYLASVMAWLERYKEYPEEAQWRHDEGSVLIAFVIDRTGQVLSLDIRRGSGSAILDRAAKDMLHRASPLPPPPRSYPAQQLSLTLPVTFSLQ